jgi:hypothetical protein
VISVGFLAVTVTYIRPKVVRVGPFLGPYASGSNVHRAALFLTCCDDYVSVGFLAVTVICTECGADSIFASGRINCNYKCFVSCHRSIGLLCIVGCCLIIGKIEMGLYSLRFYLFVYFTGSSQGMHSKCWRIT